MSRLTDEEKEAEKAARKVRARAYAARKKEFNAFVDAEKAKVDAKYGPAVEKASAGWDALTADRNAKLRAIDEQIAALRDERATVEKSFDPLFEGNAEERKTAYALKKKAEHAVDREAARLFPDMVGSAQWSVVAWAGTAYAKEILGKKEDA